MNHRKSPGRPLETGEKKRTFTDEEGVYWDVREVKSTEYDRRGGLSLVFDSGHAFRRVRTYPADWDRLTDDELSDLSRKT